MDEGVEMVEEEVVEVEEAVEEVEVEMEVVTADASACYCSPHPCSKRRELRSGGGLSIVRVRKV